MLKGIWKWMQDREKVMSLTGNILIFRPISFCCQDPWGRYWKNSEGKEWSSLGGWQGMQMQSWDAFQHAPLCPKELGINWHQTLIWHSSGNWWAEESVCLYRNSGSWFWTGSEEELKLPALLSHLPGLPHGFKKLFKPLISINPINNSSFQLCPRACLCHLCGQAVLNCKTAWEDPTEQTYTAPTFLLCNGLWKLVRMHHMEHT